LWSTPSRQIKKKPTIKALSNCKAVRPHSHLQDCPLITPAVLLASILSLPRRGGLEARVVVDLAAMIGLRFELLLLCAPCPALPFPCRSRRLAGRGPPFFQSSCCLLFSSSKYYCICCCCCCCDCHELSSMERHR
jgi:hypothetical protein